MRLHRVVGHQRAQVGQGVEQHVGLQLALQQLELRLGRQALRCPGLCLAVGHGLTGAGKLLAAHEKVGNDTARSQADKQTT